MKTEKYEVRLSVSERIEPNTPEWYAASTGNHQGLVIDESTGENIAVTYDKKHARLVAAAPCLLEALLAVIDYAENEAEALHHLRDSDEAAAEAEKASLACALARGAITKAKGL